MQDKFFNKFNENFSENELYIGLIDEMSKYKTLTHDTIKWDFVFSSSLKALSEFSLDVKLLNFLAISAINLNQKDSFKTLIEAFSFFLTTLKQEPNLLAKNGISVSKKTPNTLKSLEFLETEQYKRYKEEKMTLIKKILDNGAKSDLFKYLLETLEYINDEKDLENLLKDGAKKELAQ